MVPLRGDEHDYRHLRLMGDLGQITPMVSTVCGHQWFVVVNNGPLWLIVVHCG